MHTTIKKTTRYPAHGAWLPMTLLAAASLVACGGGGSSDNGTSATPTSTAATISLNGVASKGLMAGARVTAHPVRSDGSVDLATVLGSADSDASGRYQLRFAATRDQPYVIRVAAREDGSTTHLDEVAGVAQPLPAGFVMRALYTPHQSGAVSATASLTPFSEMAVSAAERTSGGVTAANAAQATAAVTQLLGFDPTQTTPRTVGTAVSADEQTLAVLLTAVSGLAHDGALGCTSASDGERTQCVVDTLARSASSSTIQLGVTAGGTTTDVSAALKAAVTRVLSDATLRGPVNSATLTPVVNNLGCSDTACAVAPAAGTPGDAVATAIASAKALFGQIKSDWLALFSANGATSLATGAVNVEAYKVRTAMQGIDVPVESMAKDLGALLMGIDLYSDYKAGRTLIATRSHGPVPSNDGLADYSASESAGCTVNQGTNSAVTATSAAEAGSVSCSARYYLTRTTTRLADGSVQIVDQQWRHGFSLTPQADGRYTYASRPRKRTTTTTCPVTGACTSGTPVDDLLQTELSEGTLVPTFDAAGRISAFTVEGRLPGAFRADSSTLANHHLTWSMSGTTASALDGLTATSVSRTTRITGSMVAYSDATTPLGTLSLRSGQFSESDAMSIGATETAKTLADLDLVWTTPSAEFEGAFKADGVSFDLSRTDYIPTRVQLSGALRSLSAGVATDVMTLSATVTATGYAAFDSTQPQSAANHYTGQLAAVGTVSAPGRPVLEFSLGASRPTHLSEIDTMTFQYRSLVSGTPRTVLSGSATRGTDGVTTVSVNEAASKVSMRWRSGLTAATVLFDGSTSIGTLDSNNRMLTFSDGTFLSLDLGL
jgi:hypothetical protein